MFFLTSETTFFPAISQFEYSNIIHYLLKNYLENNIANVFTNVSLHN